MRNLYLVRHGKPQYPDEHSYCVGQTDFSLSMLGHLQAVLLNEELSDKISGVYCSPLLRAVETAGHMAPELPHIIVSDLVFAFRRQFIRFFALLKVILQW